MIFLYVGIVILLLYLFAIMPTLGRKDAQSGFKTRYYAHRGLHETPGVAPENSLAAFARAVEAGYGIELDIQLSKDGQVVVFHDETLTRICGVAGRVLDYDYDELKTFPLCESAEHIPLLRDVLALVAGRVPLIVEYKIVDGSIAVCPVADAILSTYDGPYCVESFHPFALRWYKKNRPEVIRGQLADRFTKMKEYRHFKYWMLQNLLFNWMTRPDFIAMQHTQAGMWSRTICRKLFKNMAVAWTLLGAGELEKARERFDWFIFEGFMPE